MVKVCKGSLLGPNSNLYFLFVVLGVAIFLTCNAFAGSFGSLPGSDESSKLQAAGTLLQIADTALFKWGARIFAGLCIMSSAWALKEQRFAIAILCIIGAIIFGTAPQYGKKHL